MSQGRNTGRWPEYLGFCYLLWDPDGTPGCWFNSGPSPAVAAIRRVNKRGKILPSFAFQIIFLNATMKISMYSNAKQGTTVQCKHTLLDSFAHGIQRTVSMLSIHMLQFSLTLIIKRTENRQQSLFQLYTLTYLMKYEKGSIFKKQKKNMKYKHKRPWTKVFHPIWQLQFLNKTVNQNDY